MPLYLSSQKNAELGKMPVVRVGKSLYLPMKDWYQVRQRCQRGGERSGRGDSGTGEGIAFRR